MRCSILQKTFFWYWRITDIIREAGKRSMACIILSNFWIPADWTAICCDLPWSWMNFWIITEICWWIWKIWSRKTETVSDISVNICINFRLLKIWKSVPKVFLTGIQETRHGLRLSARFYFYILNAYTDLIRTMWSRVCLSRKGSCSMSLRKGLKESGKQSLKNLFRL